MAAILIDSGGGDAQGSQRGLEYDTVSGVYADFVETEVLPRAAKEAGVTFTTDPDGRATMGGSSGGSCAFTMAWFRPDLYHRVLTYSGTYVNQQSPRNPESPHGAWEYHENLIPRSEVKPIRVWLEVSENDNGSKRDEASLHNWVMANERMAAAMKAKGYHYRYVFAKGRGPHGREGHAADAPGGTGVALAGLPEVGRGRGEPMAPIYFETPAEFRAWLEQNHSTAESLLVGFHKKGTGRPSMTWAESVDEALCFGWIDGVRKGVDADRYTIRYTPRKAGSIWSTVNVAKVQVLTDQGRMQPAGLAAFQARKDGRSGIYSHEQGDVDLPEPYQGQLRENPAAWDFFRRQPPSYRKAACWWVVSAKQEKTRLSRIEKLVACSARAERLPQFTWKKSSG